LTGLYGWTIVLGSLAAGVGSLALVQYLSRYRGDAGATWFMATLAIQAVPAFAYGGGLLLFDPAWRAFAEAFVWIGLAWIGPLFLGFALEYTGRGEAVRSNWFRLLFVSPVGTTLLALTHPFHDLLWRGFRLAPVLDLATVLYTIRPWGYVAVGITLATAGVGVLLMLETILSYGPLYRREAVAVALSTAPPTVALLVWLAGVGPWPALNLAPLFLLPHVALDAYAFVGTHMFETNPVTRRAAERSASNALRDPMLTVDTEERIVHLNGRARELFGVDESDALPVPLARFTGTGLDGMRSTGEIDVSGSDGGVFAVSYTPLTDPRAESVGGVIVLYDVTEERQRKQQLAVFNRVLRHNLRNEMTVIRGHAKSIQSSAGDPTLEKQTGAIVDSGQRLLSIANKAKKFDRIQERERRTVAVSVRESLEEIRAGMAADHPDADIAVEIGMSDPRVRTDPELLSLILSNLVENAVVHTSRPDPGVTVRVRETENGSEGTAFEVRDDNERIPDIEIDSIRAGDETPLQHGTGVGLWLVQWCVTALNGTLTFEYDDGNVVTVVIPAS
jgi:nitrogen-specific signal transduction histidine kinase